jgi:hypothetical protein
MTNSNKSHIHAHQVPSDERAEPKTILEKASWVDRNAREIAAARINFL